MRLGEHFTLDELKATSHVVPQMNQPTGREFTNLVRLVALVLDPLREITGTLIVTSGYRSEHVNKLVGGAPNSRHLLGCAADLVSPHCTSEELVDYILDLDLPFDKVIREYRDGKEWLHVQIAPIGEKNRGEVLKAHFDTDQDKMVYRLV